MGDKDCFPVNILPYPSRTGVVSAASNLSEEEINENDLKLFP